MMEQCKEKLNIASYCRKKTHRSWKENWICEELKKSMMKQPMN